MIKKILLSSLLTSTLFCNTIDIYRGNIIDSDLLNIVSFQNSKKDIDKTVNMISIGYYHDLTNIDFLFNKNIIVQAGVNGSVHNVSTNTYEGNVMIKFVLEKVIDNFYNFNLNLGFAEGLSYTTGNIDYEDGSTNSPDDKYHFQNYLQFDVNIDNNLYPDYSIFFRIHHRSGVYGIIAPPKVGSNFVGLGLSYKL